jgi:hypothetical protein
MHLLQLVCILFGNQSTCTHVVDTYLSGATPTWFLSKFQQMVGHAGSTLHIVLSPLFIESEN